MLAIVGLVCTNSVSGYVGFAVAMLGALVYGPNTTTYTKRIVLALGVLVGALGALLFTSIPGYIITRLASGSSSASSTHYRITGPLPIVIDRLANGGIGLPLGSVQTVVPQYSLYLGDELGTSLDNGVYLLIFYFGWLAVLGIGVWALLALRNRVYFVQFLFLLSILAFTGAIFSPEFAFLVGLLILAWRGQRAGSSQ